MVFYIISTPIGNLKDFTERGREVLERIDTLVCEDTRKAGALLKKLNISNKPRLIHYNAFDENFNEKVTQILSKVEESREVGLISNAGTPLIADPGYKLIKEAKKRGIKVVAIPGASSVLGSLVSSGMPTDKFFFLGFLPKKKSRLKKLLEKLKENPIKTTYIAFESPYRLSNTLQEILKELGNIEICIANDVTKLHENIETKRVGEHIKDLKGKKPKGEFTILFHLLPDRHD